jgi:hypothetical protein
MNGKKKIATSIPGKRKKPHLTKEIILGVKGHNQLFERERASMAT